MLHPLMLHPRVLVFFLTSLIACGDSGAGRDAGGDADTLADAGADTLVDSGTDMLGDAGEDGLADVGEDALADSSPDALADSQVDTTVDGEPEDASSDGSPSETSDEVVDDVTDDADAPDTETVAPLPVAVGASCTQPLDCGPDPAASCIPPQDPFWTGGYCLVGCGPGVACPAGSHCSFLTLDGFGTCLASCGAAGACERDGYGCWDIDFDGRPECAPVADGDGAVGAPCERLSDCGGGADGRCWGVLESGVAGGMCALECDTLDVCPSGTTCMRGGANGYGLCLPMCESDGDCGGDQACADRDHDGVGECARRGEGPVPMGGPCQSITECGGGPSAICLGGANFGGVCSAPCKGDAECSGDTHCVGLGAPSESYCLPDCAAGGPCPNASLGCGDFDGDLRDECAPLAGGLLPIGARCSVSSECEGGPGTFCAYPNLLCSRFCADDATCGPGGECVTPRPFAGTCAQTCTRDLECASGLSCADVDADGAKACADIGRGSVKIGGRCNDTPDCNGLQCRSDLPGNACTIACADDSACPTGSICGHLPGGPSVCLRTCESDDVCRVDDGWRCLGDDGAGARACRPFGGGPRTLGEACRNSTDCDGGAQAMCLDDANAPGGACTVACGPGCDGDAVCHAIRDGLEVCLPACGADESCRDGWSCGPADAGDMVCLAYCRGDEDCRFDALRTVCGADGLCAVP